MADKSTRGTGKKGQASTGALGFPYLGPAVKAASLRESFDAAKDAHQQQVEYYQKVIQPLLEKYERQLTLRRVQRCLAEDCPKTAVNDWYYCDIHRPR